MKFTVRVTDSAIIDQVEAASWYEKQQEGLGRDFSKKVTMTREIRLGFGLGAGGSLGASL